MMISTKGRYALQVMIDIAEHSGGQYITLKDIATRQEISEKYLESIIPTLSRAYLLEGVRGKGGGYRLTRAPKDYSVGEILRLVEGPLAPVSCLKGSGVACEKSPFCKTLPMWTKLDDIVNDYLDSVTLASLLENGK
ncbi:MAG: RrF2 family transcriptional regulator [Ruminococcaceae bacterium]|nr:RrF2 family transcriptional regulator [Oscillospiraceae bacterium]